VDALQVKVRESTGGNTLFFLGLRIDSKGTGDHSLEIRITIESGMCITTADGQYGTR